MTVVLGDPGTDIAGELAAIEHNAQERARLYDAGCRLLAMGLPVLPINDKRPCNAAGQNMRKWQIVRCDAARLRRGLNGACDPRRHHSGRVPDSKPGIGLRMGPGSCIDVETDSAEERKAVDHLFRDCERPKTVSFKSKRGRHDLYRYDGRLHTLGRDVFMYKTPAGESVKIRIGGQKGGAQSVIPPSRNRRYYRGHSFDDTEPAPLPEPVIERLLEQARARAVVASPDPGARSRPTEKVKQPAPRARQNAIRDSAPSVGALPCPSIIVLRGSYESLNSPRVVAAVKRAFDQSLPTCFRKRHECIWELNRKLRAIPEFRIVTRVWLESSEGRAWLQPYLLAWYVAGKRFFKGSFEECEYDLLEGFDKVKTAWGTSLAELYEQSQRDQMPAGIIERLGPYDSDPMRCVLALCLVLQRRAGDQPFPLDGRACGAVTGLGQTAVSRILRTLVRLDTLVRTFQGRRGRAAEYRFCGSGGTTLGSAADGLELR